MLTKNPCFYSHNKKEPANGEKPLADWLFGGEGGIRTRVRLLSNWFRVSPVMTTSIPLRVYFYHLNPQIALRNLGRKDGEKSGIKLYSNSRKTLINQGFWRLRCACCFSDFESCMKNVILGNLMYFSSILVKSLALEKALTPVHEIPKAPCSQGFSPLFDFAKKFAEKGELGEKTRDSNRFVWAFRDSVLRRFPAKIFAA